MRGFESGFKEASSNPAGSGSRQSAMPRILRGTRHVIVSALLLGAGIGAAAGVLSVRRALSEAGLPFPDADRLAVLQAGGRSWSPGMLEALLQSTTVFESAVGIQERAAALAGVESAEIVRLESVSAGYFHLLGVHPARGRGFSTDEDRRGGATPVAVISDALWRRRFARDADVLTKQITIDGRRLEVIGVMPPDFGGLIGRTDVWAPLGSARWLAGDTAPERPTSRWFEVIARRRPQLAHETAQTRYAAEARAAISRIPGGDRLVGPATRFALVPLADARVPAIFRDAALVLTLAVSGLLVLVIVNVWGLELVRADDRTRELGIRLAVGANLRHIAKLGLHEATVVAVLGAFGALALRPLFLSWLAAIQPPSPGFGVVTSTVLTNAAFRTDTQTLLAVAGMAMLGAIPIALIAVIRWRNLVADPRLRDRITSASPHARIFTARTFLVVVQATLACAVVCCGVLLTRSTSAVLARDRGYKMDDVVIARMDLPGGYDSGRAATFYQRVVDRLLTASEVTAASVSNCAPGSGRCRQTNVMRVDDRPLDPSVQPTIGLHFVTPGHFDTLGARMSRGRMIADTDVAGSPAVVVISEPLAARLWPGDSPIGRTLEVFTANGSLNGNRTVVGAVAAISFDVESDRGLDVFLPAAQAAWSTGVVFLRGRGSRSALADTLARVMTSVDRGVPISEVGGLEKPLERSLGAESFLQRTLLAFGLSGLVLAAFGTYALVAQAAARAERELAIRMALGATPRQIAGLVSRRGVAIMILACSAGALGAVWASGLLTTFLHGLSRWDPIAIAGGPLLTGLAVVAAVWRPATKAARTNPVVALKLHQ